MTDDREADRAGREPLFPMRTVVLGAFLPSLTFEVGVGAMLPVIAISATRLGADLALAGFMAALVPIGKILADLPAGALAARMGDRGAMVLAGIVATAGFIGLALAPVLAVLGLGVLAVGAASAVFNLARHSYLTEITPPLRRARVLSTLAGVHRIGLFIGPFAGAAVIHGSSERGAYWLAVVTALLATAVLVAVGEEPRSERRATRAARRAGSPSAPPPSASGRPSGSARGPTIRAVMAQHRRLFSTLGIAVLLVGAVRGARQTVLPLWGEHLGLDPATTSLVFGLAGAVDMLLFYPAGKVMDRFGRLWIGVPSMAVMAAAMTMLPFTHTVAGVAAVAALLGLGNGMGSGIIMTLGADVAPGGHRATFLGVWRLFQDSGDAVGPLVISAGAALGSLAAGIWAAATLGAAAVGALARWVPMFSVHANRTTRRRAGMS